MTALCPFAHARIIYMDDDATGTNDDTSRATFPTLRTPRARETATSKTAAPKTS